MIGIGALIGAGVSGGRTAAATPAPTVTETVTAFAEPDTTTEPAATAPDRNTIPAGTWQVPQDVKPGTYRASGGDCYWARLRNLDGDLNSILANGNLSGPTTVTIRKGDRGFETTCEWTRR